MRLFQNVRINDCGKFGVSDFENLLFSIVTWCKEKFFLNFIKGR